MFIETSLDKNPRTLLVVDAINDFINPKGALYVNSPDCPAVISNICESLRRAEHTNVVFVNDSHDDGDPEFAMFPPHALSGTWGTHTLLAIWEAAASRDPIVVYKTKFDGLYDTALEAMVMDLPATHEFIVTGDCTDICVMYTVASLRLRGFKVTVLSDAVCSFNKAGHEFALGHMKNVLGAEVMLTSEYRW